MHEAALHLIWHKRNHGLQAMAWLKRKILDTATTLNADINTRIGR
ncbi:hypothetical protein [Novosphingobium humi]|uniref:Uncharacterized protein n=1 Tax=Novosphingobium humi TaxID=2282397 RepID=A0ABY7U0S1_9SPHN|nr:hypothetical protein [Novosphingobium humi]WCT79128.1 hypothetical protein PQ457_19140 [Novosphingobium humi]